MYGGDRVGSKNLRKRTTTVCLDSLRCCPARCAGAAAAAMDVRDSAVCEAVGGWVVRFIVGQPTAGGVGPAAVVVCRDGGE